MKKKIIVIAAALLLCACLIGCGGQSRYRTEVEKILDGAAQYTESCDKEAFLRVSELLSGQELYIRFYDGELRNADDLPEDVQDELTLFFREHTEIGDVWNHGREGVWFGIEATGGYVIVMEDGEPSVSWADPGDYVRSEAGGDIFWTSDHRRDRDSYYKSMFYEFGLRKTDGSFWAGAWYTKYPWYSRLF